MSAPHAGVSTGPRPEGLDGALSNASPSGTLRGNVPSSRTHSRNPSASSNLTVGTAAGGGANLRRHQRQRSSISVKANKRLSTQPTSPSLASLPEPQEGVAAISPETLNGVTGGISASSSFSPSDRPRRPPTPPDNALSFGSPAAKSQSAAPAEVAEAEPAGGASDYFSSLAPYSHSTNSTPAEVAANAAAAAASKASREQEAASPAGAGEVGAGPRQHEEESLPDPPTSSGLVTTRSELSLFDDEDEGEGEEEQVSASAQADVPQTSAPAPAQEADEVAASSAAASQQQSADGAGIQSSTAAVSLAEEAAEDDSDSESNDPTTPKVTQQSFPGSDDADERDMAASGADVAPPPAVPPKNGLPTGDAPEAMATPPMVPAKDVPSLPSSPWLRQEASARGSSSPRSVASSSTRSSPRAWTPRTAASAGIVDGTPGPSRRLSLLAGDSVVGGPRSTIRPAPRGGHHGGSSSISSGGASPAFMAALGGGMPVGPSTPSMGMRRASSGKKASISYIASPSANSVETPLRSPKTINGPFSAPAGSDFGGSSGSGAAGGSRLSGITTGSPSTAGSSGGDSARSSGIVAKVLPIQAGRKEDGETVMTSHKDLLAAIASKERRCAELKEELKREEAELKELHRSFQSSAARELYSEGAATTSAKAGSHRAAGWQNGSVSSISTLPSLEGSGSRRESEVSILSVSEADAASQSPAGAASDHNSLSASAVGGGTKPVVSPGGTASDTWKSLSGKLSTGIGSQLNAFLDQLASPAAPAPPEKGNVSPAQTKPPGPAKVSDMRAAMRAKSQRSGSDAKIGGLAALTEEGNEGVTSPPTTTQRLSLDRATSPSSLRRPPSDSATSATSNSTAVASDAKPDSTPKHAKRTSMFGSFSAFQKQVEQQLQQALLNNPPPVEKASPSSASTDAKASEEAAAASSGWSAWQKKLKEAKESASGLLATAEKKLGQAMTIDDLLYVSAADEKGNTSPDGQGRAGANLSRSGSNASGRGGIGPLTGGFSEQNERERQALDEIWGTTSKRSSMTSPETQTRKLSPQMLLELEAGSGVVPLRSGSVSPASGGGGGARRNSPASSHQQQAREASTSPTSEKRNSAFLSLFWGNADEEKTSTPHAGAAPRKKPNGISTGGMASGSGQSKSRLAAQLATKERKEEDLISLASPTSATATAAGAQRKDEQLRTPTQGRSSGTEAGWATAWDEPENDLAPPSSSSSSGFGTTASDRPLLGLTGNVAAAAGANRKSLTAGKVEAEKEKGAAAGGDKSDDDWGW